ncbi:MAG: molybdotransferase-like divisome protein Glp, partial [Trebonia sp.]
AEGCVLAEDVTAAVPLPPFDNSAMDGYAVQAGDVAGASLDSPAILPVTGEIAAGDIGVHRLAPGTAIRIMTGAQLPAGADAVVPVEWTDGGNAQVAIHRPAERGNAVRYAGGDAAEGETLLTAGTRMRPMQIAVAASAGRKAVAVRPRPRVVVLSTGDELTEPGTPLVPGRIWDSNSYMIAAAAREAGAVAYRRSGVPDDPKGLLPALEEQLSHADLLITTGGVSMGGEHDVVKAALRELGTVTFRKVAMQPGMPQGFGLIGKGGEGGKGPVPLFTLPGNPVSAYVSFQIFVRPAIAALQGTDDLSLPTTTATLTAPVRSPSGRRSYLRGTLDGTKVTPLSGQGSHQIAYLGRANALIVVPEWETHLPAGDPVDVLILP